MVRVMNFEHLKVGDRVVRTWAAKPMLMEVTGINLDDNTLICGAVQPDGSIFRGDWTFDRNSGVEEDHDLGWGVKFGRTGSYLVEVEKGTGS